MAEITAGMVKELRELTGLGMMECKKALEEAGGDMKKAEELLRIKSGAKASKAASRVAADGAIGTYLSPDGRTGAMVEVNAETDFVAKNPDFTEFARALAELVATQNPTDVAKLSNLEIGGQSAEATRQALVQKIGENISVRRFERIESPGRLVSYVHPGSKIAVMVDLEGDETLAKDLAMHIAFAKPLAMAPADVPAELIEKERKIAAAKAAESGKPANIMEKMVEGGVQKFLKEVTLLGQPFVKNDKQTIDQLLKTSKAAIGAFVFYVVGEGIEKKKDDFASEVKAQMDQARQKDRDPQPS